MVRTGLVYAVARAGAVAATRSAAHVVGRKAAQVVLGVGDKKRKRKGEQQTGRARAKRSKAVYRSGARHIRPMGTSHGYRGYNSAVDRGQFNPLTSYYIEQRHQQDHLARQQAAQARAAMIVDIATERSGNARAPIASTVVLGRKLTNVRDLTKDEGERAAAEEEAFHQYTTDRRIPDDHTPQTFLADARRVADTRISNPRRTALVDAARMASQYPGDAAAYAYENPRTAIVTSLALGVPGAYMLRDFAVRQASDIFANTVRGAANILVREGAHQAGVNLTDLGQRAQAAVDKTEAAKEQFAKFMEDTNERLEEVFDAPGQAWDATKNAAHEALNATKHAAHKVFVESPARALNATKHAANEAFVQAPWRLLNATGHTLYDTANIGVDAVNDATTWFTAHPPVSANSLPRAPPNPPRTVNLIQMPAAPAPSPPQPIMNAGNVPPPPGQGPQFPSLYGPSHADISGIVLLGAGMAYLANRANRNRPQGDAVTAGPVSGLQTQANNAALGYAQPPQNQGVVPSGWVPVPPPPPTSQPQPQLPPAAQVDTSRITRSQAMNMLPIANRTRSNGS